MHVYRKWIYLLLTAALWCSSSCKSNTRPSSDDQEQAIKDESKPAKTLVQAESNLLPDGEIQLINTSPLLNAYNLIGDADLDLQNQVQSVFDAFRNAVLHYDGSEAVSYLSSSSIDYYANVLSAARLLLHDSNNYNRFESKLPPTVKTTARIAASRLSKSFIDQATPEQLYEIAFKQGWIGYKSLSTARLEHFNLYEKNGDQYILADFIYGGTSTDNVQNRVGFQYEKNRWKIDLVPLYVAIDIAIDQMIEQKNLDKNDIFHASVSDSEDQLNSDIWPVYTNQTNMFSVRFPKTPVENVSNDSHIYTASHHRFGQFGVKVEPYTKSDDPVKDKQIRDLSLKSFLVPLGSAKPTCNAGDLDNGKNIVIKCDFEIPDKQSRGKAVWIFTPSKQYLLFNIARTDQYDDKSAVSFVESFSFLGDR
jgi:hypothetical protein